MSLPANVSEIFFLLDGAGSLVVYQEKDTSWLGVLAFSTEANAQEFCRDSNLDASESPRSRRRSAESIAGLITQVKKRMVRNLLLDLDYTTGECTIVEFEGDRLGPTRSWRFGAQA